MSGRGGDWRNGPAYDFVDEIGVEKIAHEFLRRNGRYAADYATLSEEERDEGVAPALAQWGLRFRGRPGYPSRPGDHGVAAAGRSAPCAADPPAGRAVRRTRSRRSRPGPDHIGR